jgi:hypothetical protein
MAKCQHGTAELVSVDSLGVYAACYCNGSRNVVAVGDPEEMFFDVDPGSRVSLVRGHFDNPPINDVLCAADVLLARLDRDAKGHVFPEIKYAVLVQVLRSIAMEQVGASASVKALAYAALVVCDE